jgi:hypothetical protein
MITANTARVVIVKMESVDRGLTMCTRLFNRHVQVLEILSSEFCFTSVTD